MARESLTDRRARLRAIIAGLRNAYPDAHCELRFSTPLELLIATILSAQCTDRQVNIVTESLFQKYPSAKDYAKAAPGELENDIRRIGLFRNKAKNIRACAALLVEKYGEKVPATMEALVALPGVGRKTANVVLGNAFHLQHGIVVDTHVARLSDRLRLTRATDPEKIELALQALVPSGDWIMISHWFIWHGRRRCFARNPDCINCEILKFCPTGRKHLNEVIRSPPSAVRSPPMDKAAR